MAFDRPSWRKDYTASDQCVSKKPYKGNRRANMTPLEWNEYNKFLKGINSLEEALAKHTSVICLIGEKLEADDLIAGFVQKHYIDNKITIISSDKDLLQLLRHKNITMVDPGTLKQKTLLDWNNNPDYFIFEKCIRGEIGDNIQSAFPRIRKTRIQKAFTDSYERANIMNTVWKNHEGREFIVKHLYEENRILADLSQQPQEIRERINTTIDESMAETIKFSLFHFLKFCGAHDLKRIKDQIDNYIPMLNS